MKAILKIKNIINLRITICCLIGVHSLRFRANPNYLICMSMYIVFPFLSDVHSNEFEKSCPLFHLNQMIKEHSVWKFIIPNVSCLFFFEWEAIRNHYIIAYRIPSKSLPRIVLSTSPFYFLEMLMKAKLQLKPATVGPNDIYIQILLSMCYQQHKITIMSVYN